MGCYRMGAADSAEGVLSRLVSVVNQKAIEEVREFSVHAAVVAKDGRAIAMPADSGGGKTTLAASLVIDGFSYLSDEALVIADDGSVIPYPKPMALSEWSCQTLKIPSVNGETLVMPGDLGGKAHAGPCKLADIIIPTYGAKTPTFEQEPASSAVTALIEKSFNHYKNPERAFRLATQAAQRARVWRLNYDDPLEAAGLIKERLGG